MRVGDPRPLAIALAISLTVAVASPGAGIEDKPAAAPRKVLVELFTSQGCDSCPMASDLLGKLAKLGYGPDQVVALNFHVDSSNVPWADPFSDPSYTRRQRAYNDWLRRDDLAFTPLMMVDGRHPLVGSDRPKVVSALQTASEEPAGVVLGLGLNGSATRKALTVKVAARDASVVGRELVIGVALTEDPVTTRVRSGENAGRTLTEHHVVRRFVQKTIGLDRTGARTLDFPIELPDGSDPARFRVAAFAQDRENGVVYQADAIAWGRAQVPATVASRARDPKQTTARRKPRPEPLVFIPGLPGLEVPSTTPDPSDDETIGLCPVCGNPIVLPPFYLSRAQAASLPHVVNTG